MDTIKKTARQAGILYLLLALPAPFSLLYVPSKIMVRGDAAVTVNNLLSNEFMFRTGIVAYLFCAVMFILVSLAFYRLFKPVDENQARLLVALVIVQIPVTFVAEAFNVMALMIAKAEVLTTLDLAQRQEMAMLFLRLHGYGTITVQIFWGLWLVPLGLLSYKSGFIPRIIGILLLINAAGYVVESLSFILFGREIYLIVGDIVFWTFFGELVMILWLLIVGARSNSHALQGVEHKK